MSYSYTRTLERTFTETISRYVASKVAADLRRLRSYYNRPSEEEIIAYAEELTLMLAHGYVQSIEYGFKRNDQRVVTLCYEVQWDGTLSDSSSGGIYARADIAGASWFSFLTYSKAWERLNESEKRTFESNLPIQRTSGSAPQDGAGYWVTDRSYAMDGLGTQRKLFRPY